MKAYTSFFGKLTHSSVRIMHLYPISSFTPDSGLVILFFYIVYSKTENSQGNQNYLVIRIDPPPSKRSYNM